MGTKGPSRSERNSKSGITWTREELYKVLDLYVELEGKSLHETNPKIIVLGKQLGRTTRSVESQLLMYRCLDRGGKYSRQNMSIICNEIWKDRFPNIKDTIAVCKEVDIKVNKKASPLGQTVVNRKGTAKMLPNGPPNEVINALLSRTYGGSEAAVVPGQTVVDGLLITGQAPAGVKEVIDRLFDKMVHPIANACQDWVYLVGGPGNGKSFQLAMLLERLKVAGIAVPSSLSGVAGRYQPGVSNGDQTLHIVNDATIRPQSNQPQDVGHLAADLHKAVQNQPKVANLLVNVNRGVLIEELAATREKQGWEGYHVLFDWLISTSPVETTKYLTIADSEHHYYRTAIFKHDGLTVTARIHAVHLDILSLLELVPGGEQKSVMDIGGDCPTCAPYSVMMLDSDERWNTPIGRILESVVAPTNFENGPCSTCSAAALCPFLANAKSLRRESGGMGLLNTMRAAEISSGRLFTYRDAWSVLATAIIGPNQEGFNRDTPCSWAIGRVEDQKASNKAAGSRALIELELQRCHQSLFPNRLPSPLIAGTQSWRIARPSPVLALETLNIVDPATDVTSDWADDASNAMEEWSVLSSPIERLKKSNSAVAKFACELDSRFESLVLGWLSGDKINDVQRREHLRWLGTSYYRMVALAKGRPGQSAIIGEWINIRKHVEQRKDHTLSSDLHHGLRELMFPTSGFASFDVCLLPVFSARVDPIRGPQERNILCAGIPRDGRDAVRLTYAISGDLVWVCLRTGSDSGSREQARLPLDHFTCREAIVNACGRGFTEAGATSIPRVERLRASLVKTSQQALALVMVGNNPVVAKIAN